MQPLEVIPVSQVVTSIGLSADSIEGLTQDLNWGKIVWFILAGLGVWAFKKDWVGITTFGPYDRGFRELFGRPGRLLGQGPHPHIIGIGNLRRASVANATAQLSNRITIAGRVYQYKIQLVMCIVDERQHIYAAIYETFDEGKKDQYNGQRISYVMNIVEEVIRKLLEGGLEPGQLTTEAISAHCGDHLLLMCGTTLKRMMLTELTLVDAQIIKDGILESGPPAAQVIPFHAQHQTG